MSFHVKIDADSITRIVDVNGEEVISVESHGQISSHKMGENIAALLNIQSLPHQINVGANPQYIPLKDGFDIRIKDNNIMGEASRSLKTRIIKEHQNKLLGRLSPDFFSALCDAMHAPEQPKQTPKRKPTMS